MTASNVWRIAMACVLPIDIPATISRAGLSCLPVWLIIGLLLFVEPVYGQKDAAINKEIAELEAQLAALDKDGNTMYELEKEVKSGKIILYIDKHSGGLLPIAADAMNDMATLYFLSKDKPNTRKFIKELSAMRRSSNEAMAEMIRDYENESMIIKDRLWALKMKRSKTQKNSTRLELDLAGTVVDKQYISTPEKWNVKQDEFETTFTPPWGEATFTFKLPQTITEVPETKEVSVEVTAAKGQRFSTAMGIISSAFTEVNVQASAFSEGETSAKKTTLTFVSNSKYDDKQEFVYLTIGFQDGPKITYRYKIVR